MKTGWTSMVLFLYLSSLCMAQETVENLLFSSQDPLEIQLSFSFKKVKKNTSDSLYIPSHLIFQDEKGAWDTLKIDLRARGNFRRKKCFFAPLRLKIKAKESKETLFEGNKNLKLVLPCQNSDRYNDLVVKEYLCYKLYEGINPYYFHTRLINLSLTDQRDKQVKSYAVKAFFIEDDDRLAKRFKGKIIKGEKINPFLLLDTVSTKLDFFQYMIANTDWSSVNQHNIRILLTPTKHKVPLPYDFDMAGLVNPPYAQVSELLPIKSIHERLFRGFCRTEGLFAYVRAEFIRVEPVIWSTFKALEPEINPKELPRLREYIEAFYREIKNDQAFHENILVKCRTNQ